MPRIGLEYVAGGNDARLAFRVGYHREPAHGVTASLAARDGSGGIPSRRSPSLASRQLAASLFYRF